MLEPGYLNIQSVTGNREVGRRSFSVDEVVESVRNFVLCCIGNLGLEFRQKVKAGGLTPTAQKGDEM